MLNDFPSSLKEARNGSEWWMKIDEWEWVKCSKDNFNSSVFLIIWYGAVHKCSEVFDECLRGGRKRYEVGVQKCPKIAWRHLWTAPIFKNSNVIKALFVMAEGNSKNNTNNNTNAIVPNPYLVEWRNWRRLKTRRYLKTWCLCRKRFKSF